MNSLLGLRKLRYRRLSTLIGQAVTIPHITQTEASITPLASTVLGGDFQLRSSIDNLKVMLWKYGFLDLHFIGSGDLLGRGDKLTRQVTRELGYSPRPGGLKVAIDPRMRDPMGVDRDCLEMLIEDIETQRCHFCLFLDSKWSEGAMARVISEYAQAGSIRFCGSVDEWFPVTFTIQDACLSNSSAVWLAKHTYL